MRPNAVELTQETVLSEGHWGLAMSSALRTLQWERKTVSCFPGVPRDKHQAGTVLKEVKITVWEGHFL